MKFTMVMASSLNGKITRGDDPKVSDWSSPEDYEFFKTQMAACDVMVMGRNTYEVSKPKPHAKRLHIVMTSQPERFTSELVAGSLEFTNGSAAAIQADLAKRGYQNVLIAGGGRVNAAFLAAGLIDEIYITFEPHLFGNGADLVGEIEGLDVQCELLKATQLNDRGSMLLHYRVVRP